VTDRTLTYYPLAQLQPDPANPKAHAIDTIGESIGRFGYVEPIVLDERTGYIISGHGRTKTLTDAKARGEAPPEGVQIGERGEWMVPVVGGWASRNDAEARGALIALNRTGQLGGWEDAQLLTLLDTLASSDAGLTGIGFDINDIDDLMDRLGEHDPKDNTNDTTTISDYSDRYDEQGRRLIVLDYDKDDYPAVTARLKVLRERTGTESNAEAILAHLIDLMPDAEANEG
jgi:hypothetical protein